MNISLLRKWVHWYEGVEAKRERKTWLKNHMERGNWSIAALLWTETSYQQSCIEIQPFLTISETFGVFRTVFWHNKYAIRSRHFDSALARWTTQIIRLAFDGPNCVVQKTFYWKIQMLAYKTWPIWLEWSLSRFMRIWLRCHFFLVTSFFIVMFDV